MTLLTKSGPLYFSAVGSDPETGIQDVQIWVEWSSEFCDAPDTCFGDGSGLLSAPKWTSTSPKKNPGEPMTESSLLVNWVELSTSIGQRPLLPGESRFKSWKAWAVVKNNLGMSTQTGPVWATWSESA
jgi:hypothetical protein